MRLVTLTAALIALAMPAAAYDCHVSMEKWRPVDELKTRLKSQGWVVHNVTVDDGCYEVYGKDESGRRVEVVFHPTTFAELGMDD
ncbi:Peptidase propeptide and YPEB domain-containing protein [Paracoccus thiocyanatus]|uniref:Peptidase propeptide and YPEB domain-containing protein n=1 Tax=Paracoccus thiocyanatus TaxID=34006 RepID=A0A1N6PJG9_9RHOB|nr:PepSY domain-containing protein [Paracoccus thiocyanatus]SIQ04359.1 Peptidase propeptide and YPEB domain-containing protein [Paracoccus thiocyanatus]